MNAHVRPTRYRLPVLLLSLVLGLGMALVAVAGAPTARADEATEETGTEESTVRTVTDAEFRWGVNAESTTKGHAPGTFNVLYAGDVSQHLPEPNMNIEPAQWNAQAGDVAIEKRSESGSLSTATWADATTDRSGRELSAGASSGLEMVFSGGTGEIDPEAGTATIEWDGTASIVYYSGFVYMTLSDPVLTVTESSATLTATMGGHSSSREDTNQWEELDPQVVTVADLPRECVTLDGDQGFSVSPEYLGVEYGEPTDAEPQYREGENWGSFPESLVDFARSAGGGQFWYSSGGSFDSSKVPFPVSIGWGEGDSDDLEEICESPSSGGSDGILGRVVDDTIEDILRSAGTDVSDTAAAWMDEAWKPAQPGAVNAVRDGAGDSGGASGGATSQTEPGGGADAVAAESGGGHELDPVVEYVSSGAPVTAGTVGAAVASAPAKSRGSSSGTVSPPEPGPAVTDQATVPVSASSPLTPGVIYAQTSASQEAGDLARQWPWWMGGALLALAAALFSLTVRRRD